MSEDLECVVGHVREDIVERPGVTDVVGKDEVGGRGKFEWIAREDEIKEATSNSPDVGFFWRVSVTNILVLLWGHVSVASGSNVGDPFVVGRKSEVSELEQRSTGAVIHDTHEDVLGFDVAMVDTCIMAVLNRVDQLGQDVLDGLSVTGNATLHDILIQVSEIAVFENDEVIL